MDEWASEVEVKLVVLSDLVSAEGRYHRECFSLFKQGSPRPGTSSYQGGRKEDEKKGAAFKMLCKYIEEEDDGQYSLSELIEKIKSYDPTQEPYSPKHLKRKLKEHYQEGITLTDLPGQRCIVCFTGIAHRVLHSSWYSDKCSDQYSEKLRVIRTAAQLLRQEIRGTPYDTSMYPTAEDMKTGGTGLVPDLLSAFMNELLDVKGKKQQRKDRQSKLVAHSIITTLKPRSFLSPILLGLGVTLHRLVGSKVVVDMLHNIGVSSSYKEVLKFEAAIASCAPAIIDPGAYVQPVFDNADHNVRTLNGYGTFHTMGGIVCVTPKSGVNANSPVHRPTAAESRKQAASVSGFLPVKPYFQPEVDGYSKIVAEDLRSLQLDDGSIDAAESLDLLWASGIWNGASLHSAWSGFMETAHHSEAFEVSCVIPLPFINLNATNKSTVFTALSYSRDLCDKQIQSYVMVTFDQQLYCIAVPMVLAAPEHSPLKKIIVRLGGFHLLKSFIGAIGNLMAGSGIEECLGVVYAKNSVEQMLNGNAYSRAIRGHYLTLLALTTIILECLPESDFKASLRDLSDNLQSGKISASEAQNSPLIKRALKEVRNTLADLAARSRTCKLWAQYMEMVKLVLLFLRAERSGNWILHLAVVHRMLAYFHAAGHLNYAKSGQIYLQQMLELKTKLPSDEFKKFVESGYFTIRRSSKFWCGVSTDMTIEQVLMRAIKALGGLTRGRGMSDFTIGKWIHCAPSTSVMIDATETFCGVAVTTSDQHVELRKSRRKDDRAYAEKLLEWLRLHNPFDRNSSALVCISTGRVAAEKVNCDNAQEIGTASMKKMHGLSFDKIHLHRKDSCISIAAGLRGATVRGKVVNVNPDLLFHRMLLTKRSENELAFFLSYELKEPPPALFDDVSLRQGTKSSLMSVFPATTIEQRILAPSWYVVDGGHLLRQVPWLRSETYGEICNRYIDFLRHQFRARTVVVFDGYDQSSTKDPAHLRRAGKGCVDIEIEENIIAVVAQDAFLTNGWNKMRLISMLSTKLRAEGFIVHQAPADADRLIVTTAIKCAERGDETYLVGRDTDLAVLMIALTPESVDLKLLIPGQRGKAASVYSSKQCQEALGDMI